MCCTKHQCTNPSALVSFKGSNLEDCQPGCIYLYSYLHYYINSCMCKKAFQIERMLKHAHGLVGSWLLVGYDPLTPPPKAFNIHISIHLTLVWRMTPVHLPTSLKQCNKSTSLSKQNTLSKTYYLLRRSDQILHFHDF